MQSQTPQCQSPGRATLCFHSLGTSLGSHSLVLEGEMYLGNRNGD